MANQLNFATAVSGVFQRPSRIAIADTQLMQTGVKQIVFGTHPNDNVEVWVYNVDGSFAGHLRLNPSDPALVISTLIDNTGATEVLNVDMRAVGQRLALEPGRYGLVLNFFRDEVGTEGTLQLYIADISQDRTEVVLKPTDATKDLIKQVYEFIEPSVPRLYAKAIIDQVFGKALSAPAHQNISVELVNGLLEDIHAGILAQLTNANTSGIYTNLVNTILDRTYTLTLDLMAADKNNYNVQRADLETYVLTALGKVIQDMQASGEVDPRLQLS